MGMLDSNSKKQLLRSAILDSQKIKIWLVETPEEFGHILNPYEILEDARMIDYVCGFSEEQNLFRYSCINAIKNIEILKDTFVKPIDWKEQIDWTKYSISKSNIE